MNIRAGQRVRSWRGGSLFEARTVPVRWIVYRRGRGRGGRKVGGGGGGGVTSTATDSVWIAGGGG